MATAGGNDGIRVTQDARGQRVTQAQHLYRVDATAPHDVEVEAGREDVVSPGNDYDGAVFLCAIERRIELVKYRR